MVELSTREFNNFDHDTRKWSKNIYNNKQFVQLLTKKYKTEQFESQFYPYKDISLNNYKMIYPNYSHSKIYNVLRNLEIGTQNIQFNTLGDFGRDCGQLVKISLGDQTLKSRVEGVWLIYECKHIIQKDYYYNNIIAYRTLSEVSPDLTNK